MTSHGVKKQSTDDKTSKDESLKKELEHWKGKADEYLNGWKRAKADYINLKKDTEKHQNEFIQFANAFLISELLPIIDNFNKAFMEARQKNADSKDGWLQGFEQIEKQFNEFLAKRGIKKIDTKGKSFNPEFHEAVEREKQSNMKSGQIIREVSAGYTLQDKVILPAKVIVVE